MKIPTIRTNRPYIKKPPNSFLLFVKEKREEGVGKDLSSRRCHIILGKMVGGVTELICMAFTCECIHVHVSNVLL